MSNRNRILLSLLLLFVILFSSCEIGTKKGYAVDYDIWDGSVDTSWYDNYSTQSTYFIDSASQLAGLAYIVNNNIDNFIGDYFYLTKSLDLNGYAWTPIGEGSRLTTGLDGDLISDKKTAYRFAGVFNGLGHEIKGLTNMGKDGNNYVPNEDRCVDSMFVYGLFGLVRYGGIYNLTLTDIDIDFTEPIYKDIEVKLDNGETAVVAKRFLCDSVGGLVAQTRMDYEITHCSVGTGGDIIENQYNVSESTIGLKAFTFSDKFYEKVPTASYDSLEFSKDADNVITGIIFSQDGLTVEYDIKQGSPVQKGFDLGGEEEYPLSRVRAVAGGLVGRAGSKTEYTSATLRVTGSSNYCSIEGGVSAGGLIGLASYTDVIVIKDCVNFGNVISRENSGGLLGLSSAETDTKEDQIVINTKRFEIENCTNYGNLMARTNAGGIAGQIAADTVKIKTFRNYGSYVNKKPETLDAKTDAASMKDPFIVPVRLASGILIGYISDLENDFVAEGVSFNMYLQQMKYYGRLGSINDEYLATSFYARIPADDPVYGGKKLNTSFERNVSSAITPVLIENTDPKFRKYFNMRDYIGKVDNRISDEIKFYINNVNKDVERAANNNYYTELID